MAEIGAAFHTAWVQGPAVRMTVSAVILHVSSLEEEEEVEEDESLLVYETDVTLPFSWSMLVAVP